MVAGCTDSDAVDPAQKTPWCERKESYIHHVEHEADPEVRLVSLADKVHNARAILLDFFEIGDEVFDRFTGKKQGTLWYYRALIDAFRAAEGRGGSADPMARSRQRLMNELERVVSDLERQAGGPGANPCRG
jgi:hypothetical protein